MQKIALIPAYEPDYNLILLVEELYKNDFFIVVVNDGSGEKYSNIFSKIKNKAYVISYYQNKGKGFALKKGLKFIKENFKNEYIVVTMDADGQHTVKDAINLCNYVEKNPNELVLGKRMRNKNTPLKSKIGNEITRFVYRISTGINIYDTQTGLRSFSNKLIDYMLKIEGDRYEYEMNVLLILPKNNVKITEIEIKTIYINNNSGTHFNALKDSLRIYKQIIKFSISSLTSFIIDYIIYTIMLIFTNNLILSNIIARILSGTANYTINKKIVFNNKSRIIKSFTQYIVLAIVILTLNTVILNILVNKLGINAYLSKILVEMILFIFSWLIQKKIIFKKKGKIIYSLIIMKMII